MPLTPKDDVDESRVASNQSDDEALEELRQRVDDLDERTRSPGDGPNNPHEARNMVVAEVFSEISELNKRVERIESRVDQHEAVIRDLIQLVEIVGAATEGNGFGRGFRAVEENGSDGYPWTWDAETLDFKAEKFE